MKDYSVKYCKYQLARAKKAHLKASQTGDGAAYERTSDNIGKWEANLRIAGGTDENTATNRIFGLNGRDSRLF